jgi:hypothetical protein
MHVNLQEGFSHGLPYLPSNSLRYAVEADAIEVMSSPAAAEPVVTADTQEYRPFFVPSMP